ncbi:hypothetical protein BJ508DRAFT_314313 [Ascobolus immersus RN42]|uniref:Uncharacterized protein n=1 Tax=Ascobolus immersus RN42 TaxID=1160509 RepID=A0A3N4HFG1_ASCIM|nr:hypothetical protein BJ508DRAFT_314313 [Ascobolus immersus RN42]
MVRLNLLPFIILLLAASTTASTDPAAASSSTAPAISSSSATSPTPSPAPPQALLAPSPGQHTFLANLTTSSSPPNPTIDLDTIRSLLSKLPKPSATPAVSRRPNGTNNGNMDAFMEQLKRILEEKKKNTATAASQTSESTASSTPATSVSPPPNPQEKPDLKTLINKLRAARKQKEQQQPEKTGQPDLKALLAKLRAQQAETAKKEVVRRFLSGDYPGLDPYSEREVEKKAVSLVLDALLGGRGLAARSEEDDEEYLAARSDEDNDDDVKWLQARSEEYGDDDDEDDYEDDSTLHTRASDDDDFDDDADEAEGGEGSLTARSPDNDDEDKDEKKDDNKKDDDDDDGDDSISFKSTIKEAWSAAKTALSLGKRAGGDSDPDAINDEDEDEDEDGDEKKAGGWFGNLVAPNVYVLFQSEERVARPVWVKEGGRELEVFGGFWQSWERGEEFEPSGSFEY